MIEQPELFIDAFVKAGAQHISVHAEACRRIYIVYNTTDRKTTGATAGVALNPATPLIAVEEVLDDIDLLLLMSVNPGFGGQSYITHTTDKIRRAHQLLDTRGRSNVHIQIDGGISVANVREIVNAGATCLVAGSSIFAHGKSIAAGVAEFRSALR